MSGKVRNPSRRCKICGAKCEKRMRYCTACATQRKAACIGIDPHKVHVGVIPPCTTRAALGLDGVYFTPEAALDVVRGQSADIVTMNPPLSTGGYLGEMLPEVKHSSAPRRGVPEAQKPPRQKGKLSPANLERTA